MSKQATATLIGSFVLGGFALALGVLFFVGAGTLFEEKNRFILYFDESVKGLEVGAAVKFRGVNVGRVESIGIYLDDARGKAYIPVEIEIDRQRGLVGSSQTASIYRLNEEAVYKQQLANGLHAQLEFQSYFTGLLFIELDYEDEGDSIMTAALETPLKQIPTSRSEVDQIWALATEVFKNLREINFKEIAGHINSVFTQIGQLDLKGTEGTLVAALDQLRHLGEHLDSKIDPLSDELQAIFAKAEAAFSNMDKASDGLVALVEPNTPFLDRFESALLEIKLMARSVRKLADLLERNPKALIAGKAISE